MRPVTWSPRSPFTFLGLTLIIAVPFWIAGAVIKTPAGAAVQLPISSLWFLCPVVAAAVLSFREARLPGVQALLLRTIDPRRLRAPWVVAVLLLSPAVYLAAYGVMAALGRPVTAPSIGFGNVLVLVALFLVAGLTEEGGWTAYASDPLRQRFGALGAALVLGTIWGLGHVIPDLQGGHDAGWIFWQRAVAGIALRVLMMWVFVNSGSVLSVVLFHAVDNLAWQVLSSGTTYDPMVVGLLLAVAALVVTLRCGPALIASSTTAELRPA